MCGVVTLVLTRVNLLHPLQAAGPDFCPFQAPLLCTVRGRALNPQPGSGAPLGSPHASRRPGACSGCWARCVPLCCVTGGYMGGRSVCYAAGSCFYTPRARLLGRLLTHPCALPLPPPSPPAISPPPSRPRAGFPARRVPPPPLPRPTCPAGTSRPLPPPPLPSLPPS